MYDKIGAALGVLAVGVAGWAAYRTTQPVLVNSSIHGDTIRNYLMTNPEVLVEAAQVYEQRQREQEAAADGDLIASNRDAIFNDGYSLVAGNPDGDLTIVEFSDYNCGFCKRAHGEIARFLEADPNVRIVVKEFPILGPGSTLAARAALASRSQKEGALSKAFNDALMSHRGGHSEASVLSIAEEVGLNIDTLRVDMQDPAIEQRIQETYQLAQSLRINGTPAFIVGKQVIRGFVEAESLRQIAAEARTDG